MNKDLTEKKNFFIKRFYIRKTNKIYGNLGKNVENELSCKNIC